MIGSEKQIQFAKAILEGAKALFESPHTLWSGVTVKVDSDGSQLAAIAIIEALERGDLEEAERLYGEGKAAGWVESAVDLSGPAPAVRADRVIEALKGAYYTAKERGLVKQI